MHFSYACVWDKGDYYEVNQDSFALQTVLTGNGPYGMAVVCDGVGSLARGEYASGCVTEAMTVWFYDHALPLLCKNVSARVLTRSCKRALGEIHYRLAEEGRREGYYMGTTLSMLILAPKSFYFFHIGDCSCYKINKKIKEISMRQVNAKGELLGAIGVGELPNPIIKKGTYRRKDRFVLCSDGLNRSMTVQGLEALGNVKLQEAEKQKLFKEIISRGRQKGERDNCTGIVIGRK